MIVETVITFGGLNAEQSLESDAQNAPSQRSQNPNNTQPNI